MWNGKVIWVECRFDPNGSRSNLDCFHMDRFGSRGASVRKMALVSAEVLFLLPVMWLRMRRA